ncbi:hypothetical protein [Blastomonas sp. AAP25]|uniref:hypothetical protein n=1 Tax=Blastomonas sp. AAP25 TaxID=1523416 RepID=UPI000AA51F75|nr:hypothetical protein [Blastomonas sp. AAP25]
MNQSTIHPADCRCSKCPGTREQRQHRFRITVFLYMAILIGAGTLMIIATAAR